MKNDKPDIFANPTVRVGIMVLAVGWLAIEIKRGSGWGIGLAAVLCLFAGYELFVAPKTDD